MAYQAALRDALLIQSGPPDDPDRLHLHVVLTAPCSDGFHLLGSIASIRPGQFHDPVCIVNAGEHPFIRHPSYFEYRRLKTIRSAHLTKCVDARFYQLLAPVSEELHRRICAGIAISIHAPRGMKGYWGSNKPSGF